MSEFGVSRPNHDASDAVRANDDGHPVHSEPYSADGLTEHSLRLSGEVAERIMSDFAPATALDVGCAMGSLVEQLLARGVDARGVALSDVAIETTPDAVKNRVWVGSLGDPLPAGYDLIVCIEAMEQLPPVDGRRALSNMCAATERILFSSAQGGNATRNCVNVQPPEAWSVWFAEESFYRSAEYDASYLSPSAVLYERRNVTIQDVVREYDSALWRARKDALQFRDGVRRLSARLSQADDAQPAETRTLEAKILDLQERLLATRDAVVGMEAAYGQAAGERDQLSAQLARYQAAATQLEEILSSRTLRTTWRLLAPYRRLRRLLRR